MPQHPRAQPVKPKLKAKTSFSLGTTFSIPRPPKPFLEILHANKALHFRSSNPQEYTSAPFRLRPLNSINLHRSLCLKSQTPRFQAAQACKCSVASIPKHPSPLPSFRLDPPQHPRTRGRKTRGSNDDEWGTTAFRILENHREQRGLR